MFMEKYGVILIVLGFLGSCRIWEQISINLSGCEEFLCRCRLGLNSHEQIRHGDGWRDVALV